MCKILWVMKYLRALVAEKIFSNLRFCGLNIRTWWLLAFEAFAAGLSFERTVSVVCSKVWERHLSLAVIKFQVATSAPIAVAMYQLVIFPTTTISFTQHLYHQEHKASILFQCTCWFIASTTKRPGVTTRCPDWKGTQNFRKNYPILTKKGTKGGHHVEY